MPAPRLMLVLAMASSLLWARTGAAQLVPVGPEFQVNTYSTYNQFNAAVAVDGAGNFVVVWQSAGSAESDTSQLSIQAQRYDSTGAPLGAQFQVNTYTPGFQTSPAVATDGSGNFVVVWESEGSGGSDTSQLSIQAQRYDDTGAPLGSEFQANTYTTGFQNRPLVAADGTGNFVVVWESEGSLGSDTSLLSIQTRRYDNTGAPLGAELQANTYTTDSQFASGVAVDGAGNFVVVWSSFGSAGTDTSAVSIHGQRFNSAGTPQGLELQVNTYTTGRQVLPAVAADATGGFVVVWESQNGDGADTSSYSIHGRRYDNTGVAQGAEFEVNAYTTGKQSQAAVAADEAGNFVVVWQSDGSAGADTDAYSIHGRRYDSAGVPEAEFEVNSYTTGFQSLSQGGSAVSSDGGGRFVVVWDAQNPSYLDVKARRFAAPLPLPGRITVIKPGTLAKFVAKPVAGDTFALPSSNLVATGGTLRIFDTSATAGDDSYALPSSGWKSLGNPPGAKGYKYAGAGTPADPCKVVLAKAKVIKAVCRGAGVMLTPPFTGDVGISLSLGTTDRYCVQFGGEEVQDDATLTKRKNAPAPGTCP